MSSGTANISETVRHIGPAPTIELRDVTRIFETEGGVRVDALRGISLRVDPGEFIAIRGPSGCGKSTLLNILGCLDRPSRGTYRIAGQEVSELDSGELAELRRQTFGFVFQNYNLLSSSSALENVEMPAVYAGMSLSTRRERASNLLRALGLEDRGAHRPSQLSGGEQQRVSIARALMNGGSILLADEPTGALDSGTSEEIIQLLRTLADHGHTVIVVTHDQGVARRANRQIEMLDGRIVEDSQNSEADPAPAVKPFAPVQIDQQRSLSPILISDVFEAARTAVRSLRMNPFRTFLTLLGVVIGVGAVVSMLAVGEGAKLRLAEQIDAFGASRLAVWADTRRFPGARLTSDDANAIAGQTPNVQSVLPVITGRWTVRIGNRDHTTTIYATTHEFPEIRSWPVASGTFFEEADSRSFAAVTVLGATVQEELFPYGEDPLGKYILIGKTPFLVIGTLTRKGASGFGNRDEDDTVLVPLETGARRLFGRPNLDGMTVTANASEFVSQVERDVRSILSARHGANDIQIRNSAEMQAAMSDAMSSAARILGAVGAISLLVGGIGVMNIMLVTVSERTREIGIRVATGARRSDILIQFLVEAMIVSGAGGTIGLCAGVGISMLITLITPEVRVAFAAAPMSIAFACAAAIGLVFGYVPARNAARMDPVAALAAD